MTGSLPFPPLDPLSAKIPSPSLVHSKTQKAELCRVWTELCMRERQARIRNQLLLQDFEGLEAQLALLAAKTDALRRKKRDCEELLQRLKGELPKHQGASRRQGYASDKPPELLARPLSAEWDRQLPLEMEYHTEPSPFPPLDISPVYAPGAHGRLRPGFGEYKQSKKTLDHPFYSTTAHPVRKHGGQAFPSPWSPQRFQKDKRDWLFPGQGRCHSSSSQPWPVPGRTTVLGRGHLPEEWLGTVMAQVLEGQTIGSPTASSMCRGKEARRHSVLSRGGSAEEHRDMAVRREGHHLPCDPAGPSYHLRLHSDAPSCMDESQRELPRMHLGNDSSGASVSSSAEMNSGLWAAERNTQGLPRQQRMKAKQQDADTMILNEECAHVSWERSPGLLEHEEMEIIEGTRKVLREEKTLPCWEEQGNGELREKGESKKEISVDKGGEAMGSLGLELEQPAEECKPLREAESQEDEEIRGRAGELDQGQENEGGSHVGEVGADGQGKSLGCLDQGQEDLEGGSVGGKGQASLGPGSQEGESVEGKRNLQWSNGEGEKDDQEMEGRSSEKTSKPDRGEESQNGVSVDKEGDLEQTERSQEGLSCPQKKEEAASIGSSSDEVVIGPQRPITSEQGTSGDCQTPSLHSEGPLATGAESIGEEEAEEEEEEEEEDDDDEEESEADTNIEGALAPHSNNPDATRDQQEETVIPNFQELQADSEEENKDGDLHDKDDFYD